MMEEYTSNFVEIVSKPTVESMIDFMHETARVSQSTRTGLLLNYFSERGS